jgi:hypothetical protein
VLRLIANAKTADEMTIAGEQAARLRTDREKEIARTAYADRVAAARSAAHASQKAGDAAPVVLTFAEVMDELERATTPDLLDVAADLIRSVPAESQREELEEFFVAKRHRMEGEQ